MVATLVAKLCHSVGIMFRNLFGECFFKNITILTLPVTHARIFLFDILKIWLFVRKVAFDDADDDEDDDDDDDDDENVQLVINNLVKWSTLWLNFVLFTSSQLPPQS